MTSTMAGNATGFDGVTADLPSGQAADGLDLTAARHHPHRWRLSRAGFVDVWQYYDVTLDLSAGRGILRGPNGSGKSRALEMLLPFLLDADRRHMGTGVAVKLEDLMDRGLGDRTVRQGYMWLELVRTTAEGNVEFHTLGASVRYSSASKAVNVSYFTTPLRVGHGLILVADDRTPLSRTDLITVVGPDRVVDSPAQHRDRVRTDVFGLSGEIGRERFDGLLALLHTLRHPDVGNQIEAGALPSILSAALPPLSETALEDAGQALDNLTSTREDLERLRSAREQVHGFLDTYRRWLTGVMEDTFTGIRTAAGQAGDARVTAEGLAAETNSLDCRRVRAEASAVEHSIAAAQAEAKAHALKGSPEYAALGQLEEKRRTVEALRHAATTALAAAEQARGREQDAAQTADIAASAVTSAAGTLTGDLAAAREALANAGLTGHQVPAAFPVSRHTPASRTDSVHTTLGGPLTLVSRPAPVTVTAELDLSAVQGAATAAAAAASARGALADGRLAEARTLDRRESQIREAAKAADALAQQAGEEERTADAAAEARDDAARTLARKWSEWVNDPATGELLGNLDWAGHRHLGPLLVDAEVLTGIEDLVELAEVAHSAGVGIDLATLDETAADGAQPAREAVRAELEHLSVADQQARLRENELKAERHRLENEEDEPPDGPTWQALAGVSLWQVTDFATGVPDRDRAGLEAALSGCGLLTAELDAAGSLAADNGQMLVSATGPVAATSLALKVVPDVAGCAAAGVDPATVAAVLDRIELATSSTVAAADPNGFAGSQAIAVAADGWWRNGLLRGRHPVTTAKHVGAAARAANRAARLAEIAVEFAQIARSRDERMEVAALWQAREAAIVAQVRRAPRSAAYTAAVSHANALAGAAVRARARADSAAAAVDEQSRKWQQAMADHRMLCEQADLPVDGPALEKLQRSCMQAVGACLPVPAAVGRLEAAIAGWHSAYALTDPRTQARAAAEDDAATEWTAWDTARLEYQTLESTVGQDAREVQRQLLQAEADCHTYAEEARKHRDAAYELAIEHSKVAERARQAAQQVSAAEQLVTEQAAATATRLALPGVIATLYPDPTRAEQARAAFVGGALTDPVAAAIAAERLSGLLRRARTNDATLMSEFAGFGAAVGEMYDVSVENVDGIHLYELVDAEGRRPLAAAAADLAVKYESGRAALTDEEHRVFTDFVLGEVGEEMRRRIAQADELIGSMNRSLDTIRTSHGVQVKVAWKPDAEAGDDVVALERLVKTARPVRTAAQDEQLIGLLRDRVQAAADMDPAAGYVEHLRTALDYRGWHRVEVMVSAPHLGTQRVSKRSKLSQGETRTVSYVTLFAAVDAYLSGVADERALRVILLDDAFAKVDTSAIAQMMGLLVRLDIDFLMTGHELWGCFPSVPAVDVYTVLRSEGGPAVMQHIHWDGRGRHVRAV